MTRHGKTAPYSGTRRSRRALIAEDDESLRRMLRELLEGEGYAVEAVGDGTEALKLVRASPPVLIVTDAVMPGLDGFTLCRTLRAEAQFARLPILLASASFRAPHDERLAEAAGASAFLRMPATVAEWLSAVQAAFATAPPMPVPAPEFAKLHAEVLGAQHAHRKQEIEKQRAQLRALTVLELGPPEEADITARALRGVAEAGNVIFERHLRRRDGTPIPCAVSARRVMLVGRTVIVSVARDITERNQADEIINEQLQELRRWYQVTLDREDRVRQLKHEVSGLQNWLGEAPRYANPKPGRTGRHEKADQDRITDEARRNVAADPGVPEIDERRRTPDVP